MLQILASFLAGPLLKSGIEAYRERLAAMTAQDKLAVDLAVKEIEADIQARAAAAAIVKAESGSWWQSAPRAIVCWSFALWVAKCVVWDMMLGLGSTPALKGDLAVWAGWVMALWFGGRTVEKVARIFKR